MIVRPDSAAFPYLDGENDLSIAEVGLTKRELFAAMALQGLLANPEHREVDRNNHALAEDAVRMADALVWALDQRVGSRE